MDIEISHRLILGDLLFDTDPLTIMRLQANRMLQWPSEVLPVLRFKMLWYKIEDDDYNVAMSLCSDKDKHEVYITPGAMENFPFDLRERYLYLRGYLMVGNIPVTVKLGDREKSIMTVQPAHIQGAITSGLLVTQPV